MSTPTTEDWAGTMPKIIARAWSDAEFEKRLLADPKVVLGEFGLSAQENMQIKILKVESGSPRQEWKLENEGGHPVYYLPLPDKPGDLSDQDLDAIAGGSGVTICCSVCCSCCE